MPTRGDSWVSGSAPMDGGARQRGREHWKRARFVGKGDGDSDFGYVKLGRPYKHRRNIRKQLYRQVWRSEVRLGWGCALVGSVCVEVITKTTGVEKLAKGQHTRCKNEVARKQGLKEPNLVAE